MKKLGIDVLSAATQRIAWVFDNFPRIYVSFSGGKDSTVMLHLVAKEAIKRNRKIGVLFVDLEGQYKLTIDHIKECFSFYSTIIEPYWIALPLHLRNAVSNFEPHWICWQPDRKKDWVRDFPPFAINNENYFSFFHYGMEFEEFVLSFGKWFGQGKLTACFVGIRTVESLNRWRTIATGKKQTMENKCWTTWMGNILYNVYPIYDWRTEDIWTFHAKNPELAYNKLYDRMHQAGLSIYQQRICQPYGDDQRKGLWLFHVIEPETWARVVARVNGANQGALYSQESGNILGRIKISKPEHYNWKEFALFLIDSMPKKTSEHYKNKIFVFLQWWGKKGFKDGIPDDGPLERDTPNWKRICKVLLRNDYWCKGLSFSQQKSHAYEKYLKVMRRRREQWEMI
ncbi:phosphoadenosine phosphosulfate reductase [Candidatus Pacearchaeota archaeon CG1_02_35_32]|nr:MAG: phosphoadenosine phosphosulfate reductase [Candidatus Pacearchaeota archaeon CG1_02_35_32]